MRRRDSKLTISNALIFYLFMGIVLPVCLFGMCFTLVMNHTLRKNAHEAAEQAVETSAVQVDNLISGISYTASYIIGSSDVLEKVQTIEADPTSADAMWAREYLIKCVRSLGNIALYAYNPDVSIITTNGIVVGVDYIHYLDQEDADALFALPVFDDSFSVWHEPQSDAVTADLVSYWTIRTRGEIAALLRISIPEHALWDNLANHTLLQHHLELRYQGDTICVKEFDNSAEYADPMDYSTFLRNWNMTFVATMPTAIVESDLVRQVLLFLLFFLLLLALLFIIIIRVARQISHPIEQIDSQMCRLQKGDTSLSPVLDSYQEIHSLSENLNELALRIDGLVEKAAQEAKQKEQIYYETLMAQINPHFLYNTLNGIKWMAVINGNSAVADMLIKLGNNLRYSFDHKSTYITVEKELAFLKDYFALLQMRFGSGIIFLTDIPQELLYEPIPRFCIQPFIENAMSHGFEGMSEGEIILSAAQENDTLVFRDQDNGAGMEPEKAQALLQGQGESATSTGLGVWNVQQRIQLLYGPRFGLEIQSRPGQGCTVTIRLPMQNGLM